MKETEIKKTVREKYGAIARQSGSSCCAPAATTCCDSKPNEPANISKSMGYSDEEMSSVPEGANLGLGCGNPLALASLKEGETVLDLGSGAGFDCFLASGRVGAAGKVIGVDMTPDMIDKARENRKKGGYNNVEFRLGEIENLPVADNSVDIIISNCVINLAPDKQRVYEEAYRVLKPGGRIMVSDIVLLKELPKYLKESVEAYIGCVAGASLKDDYLAVVKKAGFKNVKVNEAAAYPADVVLNDPAAQEAMQKYKMPEAQVNELTKSVVSMKISAVKEG